MNAQAHPFVLNVMLITIFKTQIKFVKQHAQLRQKKMKQYHGPAYPVIYLVVKFVMYRVMNAFLITIFKMTALKIHHKT